MERCVVNYIKWCHGFIINVVHALHVILPQWYMERYVFLSTQVMTKKNKLTAVVDVLVYAPGK